MCNTYLLCLVYSLSATNTPDTSARNFYKKLGQVLCMEFWASCKFYIYKLAADKAAFHLVPETCTRKTCTAQESMSEVQVFCAGQLVPFLHLFFSVCRGYKCPLFVVDCGLLHISIVPLTAGKRAIFAAAGMSFANEFAWNAQKQQLTNTHQLNKLNKNYEGFYVTYTVDIVNNIHTSSNLTHPYSGNQ